MRQPLLFALVCVLFAGGARAATGGAALVIQHSGYLVDANDAPLSGARTLSFGIYAVPEAGTAAFLGSCEAVVSAGYYAVALGGSGCTGTGGVGDSVLDTSDVPAGEPRWLELTVGGTTLHPRIALGAVPVAALAQRALSATTLGTELPTAFHDASQLTGVAPASVLGSDGSGLGEVNAAMLGGKTLAQLEAMIGGGGGVSGEQANAGAASPAACAPATSGVLFYDVSVPAAPTLKVCNGAYYVAIGGAVAPPPGPPASPSVTLGNGSLSPSWSTVAGATSYEVGFQPGTVLDGAATVVAVAGTTTTLTALTNGQGYAVGVRTVANEWRSSWSAPTLATPSDPRTIVTSGTGRRWSDGTYAQSCKAYRQPAANFSYTGATGSGLYTIDSDGAGAGLPFDATCDMTGDLGGWTLVFRLTTTNWDHNNADDVPPTLAKTKSKFASSVINQITGQASGSAYELRLDGGVTSTLMKASEPFYVEMNTWPVVVQYDCDRNGVYEKSKTWNSWTTDREASEGSSWVRDWVYPQNGQCVAYNGGNVMEFWGGTSTIPALGNAPISATAASYTHAGTIAVWVR